MYYITIIVGLIGFSLTILALRNIKKLHTEHIKISNDDFLLKREKPVQKKNIIFLIAGLLLMISSQIFAGFITLF